MFNISVDVSVNRIDGGAFVPKVYVTDLYVAISGIPYITVMI